jgi:heme/copper-type cytochrome/quinol oxidase subunit 2
MMNVFYYYYYLFYTKLLPDNQPHATVIFTLSFSLSLLINGVLSILAAHISNYAISNYIMIVIFILILTVNYLVFYRTGKGERLVEKKPKFNNSHKLSILLTLIFFLITTSFLFWGPIYIRNLLVAK